MPDTTVHGQNPAYHDPDCITINKFKALEEQLPHAEVLFPGSEAYEKAIFIGNLLYRFITPACVVMARTHKDIQITVKFARENGFDLTVRNGGHSYAGYCLNKGGIVVDLKHMHKVHVDEEEMTVTLEGGTIWKQAYSHLKGKLLPHIIIGGQCPTVGVSGFTLGGGLSPFSRNYGLAVDQLLEMKLVTAEGELVHLTAHETDQRKRDLFWAVRGGGGGNFGITVWMKCRIHKLRNPFGIVVCGQLSWKLPDQQEDFNEMMKVFNTTEWPKELTVDGLWTYDTTNQLLGEMTVIYNGTMDECNQVIKPLLNFKPANNLQEMHWTDWERLEEGFDPMSKVYHHHASFIFGDKGITPEVTDLIQKLMLQFQELVGKQDPKAPTQSTAHILWDHTGAATSQVAPTDTAYFWRDGVYVTTIKAQWVDPSMNEKMLDFVDFAKGKLAPYALKGYAAYLNYIDSTVKDWQQAYYGNNYCELQRIKSEWDPHNFFHFPQSIEPVGHHHPIIDTKKKWDKFCLPKPKALLPMKSDEDVYQKGREIRRGLLAGGKGTF